MPSITTVPYNNYDRKKKIKTFQNEFRNLKKKVVIINVQYKFTVFFFFVPTFKTRQ